MHGEYERVAHVLLLLALAALGRHVRVLGPGAQNILQEWGSGHTPEGHQGTRPHRVRSSEILQYSIEPVGQHTNDTGVSKVSQGVTK